MSSPCVFTVDVEDWFHILDIPATPPIEEWSRLESHVEQNVQTLLELFAVHHVCAVFFFLGWMAERFPAMVSEVARAGHEIASHGYSHDLVYNMSRHEFAEDVRRAKDILENITGQSIFGYRATGFSVTKHTPWFFDELAAIGYQYDSSVFPATRGHGGMSSARLVPHTVSTDFGSLTEFPVSVAKIWGKRICLFGGGYLRLFPLSMILSAADRIVNQGRPVTFYLHPREIQPDHPRLPMPLRRRFKSYVGLKSVRKKLNAILSRYSFDTFKDLIAEVNSDAAHNG